MMKLLSLIVPCYNEEEALKEADEIMKNPDAYPSYNNVEELMEALNDKK